MLFPDQLYSSGTQDILMLAENYIVCCRHYKILRLDSVVGHLSFRVLADHTLAF